MEARPARGNSSLFTATASVELFDPATNIWTPVSALAAPRSEASVTLLQDGRVLVVGGFGSGALATAEIYDPAANTWQSAASMSEARQNPGITLLPNGKVLVTGGGSTPIDYSDTAELYDPVSNSWSLMATRLTIARTQHAAQLLPGGNRVLLIGGLDSSLNHNTTAELFPVNDSGASILVGGSVPGGNSYASVLLADGSVLAQSDLSATAVRFEATTSAWTTSVTSAVRGTATLTALADGRVLFAGGNTVATANIYNPYLNSWTPAAAMADPHRRGASVLLNDGSVLVFGGLDSVSNPIAAVERFMP